MSVSKRQSVLWSVFDSELDRTSYLMGTMHLKDKNSYSHVKLAEKYIQDANIYAGEMNLDLAAEAELYQHFILPDNGLSLSELYTSKKYMRMHKIYAKITGQRLSDFNYLSPLAIINLITESHISRHYGFALDTHLWNLASKLNKRMNGLEPVQKQIDILQQIPLEYQAKSLQEILNNPHKHKRSIYELGKLYEEGNIHALYKKSKKSLGALKPLMLYDRNANMTEAFINLQKDSTLFAAVGAAHLSGLKGMLHLLRQKGFAIKPIFSSEI